MEKLVILAAVFLTACSCVDNDKSHQYKYKIGDVVYIKPDSSVAVITYRGQYDAKTDYYHIKFYDEENESNEDSIKDYEIYGIKN